MSDNPRLSLPTALARFLPACGVVFAFVLGIIAFDEPRGLSWASLGLATLEIAMLSAGYVASLAMTRGRDHTAPGSALSHTVSGVVAPFGLLALSTLVQGVSPAGVVGLSLATGAATGLLQWVRALRTPPPPEPTLDELESAADAALLAAELPQRDVIPLTRPDRQPLEPPQQVA